MKRYARSIVLLGLLMTAPLTGAARTKFTSLTRALSTLNLPSSTSCHAPSGLNSTNIFRRPGASIISHDLLAAPARLVSTTAGSNPTIKLTKEQVIKVFNKHYPGSMQNVEFGDFAAMLISNLTNQKLTALQLVARVNLTITRFLSGERRDFWTVDKRKKVLLELMADNTTLQEELTKVFKQTYPKNELNSISNIASLGIYKYPVTATELSYIIDDHCNFFSPITRRSSLKDKEKFAYKWLRKANRLDLFPEVQEVLRMLNLFEATEQSEQPTDDINDLVLAADMNSWVLFSDDDSDDDLW